MNVPTVEERLQHLLKQIGEPGVCRRCLAPIIWVTHRNGRHVPYTEQGLNHFINCPNAAAFKRGK